MREWENVMLHKEISLHTKALKRILYMTESVNTAQHFTKTLKCILYVTESVNTAQHFTGKYSKSAKAIIHSDVAQVAFRYGSSRIQMSCPAYPARIMQCTL